MDEDVAFENRRVLELVEALVGEIGSELIAVSLVTDRRERLVDLFVAATSPVRDDFFVDLTGEVDALADGDVLIRPHLWIGPTWQRDWPGRSHRLVFARREDRIEDGAVPTNPDGTQ